jgi:hypothetical protein
MTAREGDAALARWHFGRALWALGRLGALAGALAVGGAAAQSPETGSAVPGVEDGGRGAITNYSLLRRVGREAVEEMLAGLPSSRDLSISIVAGGAHDANSLIADLIARRLSEGGYRVVVIERADTRRATTGSRADTSGASAAPGPGAAPGAASAPGDSADAQPESTQPAAADTAGTGGATPAGGEETAAQGDSESDLLRQLVEVEGTITAEATAAKEAETVAVPTYATDRVLEFRVAEFGVKYVDSHRPYVLGPRRVDRAAAVNLTCRLKDAGTQEVKWVGDGDAIEVDSVSGSKLRLYECESFPASPLVERGAMRYVEPVLVAGIVSGLVYLFYTNQN